MTQRLKETHLEEDEGYMDEINCSQQHFEEITKSHRKPTLHTSTALPKPTNLTEYLIYYINRLLDYTTKNKARPSGYWRYVLGVYRNMFLAFYFNWISFITAPLSSFAFLLTYPIISVLLFLFEIALKISMDYMGGKKLIERISHDFGQDLSIINWGAPQLLLSEKSSQLIQSTLHTLGEPEKPLQMSNDHRHRLFDVSIAQTMTILSSLVYERQDEDVKQAYEMHLKFNHTTNPKQSLEDVQKAMQQLIWNSEKRIRTIARQYGLHFSGVTELKSLGGPFCGLFWSMDPNQPFIVVVFKGTTPNNYSEFLVDATLQRTDARSYLFGAAHEGFYDSLFPAHTDNDSSRDPYFAIHSAVKQRAQHIQSHSRDPSKPVQVYVAGHSLGAALCTLLYARWLKCPQDLGPCCQLRDAYTMGLPAVGDNDFASGFVSYSNNPVSRLNTLWRIVNQSDIICRLPPGYNNITIGHYVQQTDFFNYSHVGHVVKITHPMLTDIPLDIYPSSYQTNFKVDVKVTDTSDNTMKDMPPCSDRPPLQTYPWWIRPWIQRTKNPISFIESMYPFFISDHLPIHYFEGLERARLYYKPCPDSRKGK